MLSDADIADLKDRHPLLEHVRARVELRRAGQGVWCGKCPFHVEDTASFHVNDGECPLVERRHTYHCFGCGAHGDLFSWLKELHSLDFLDAVKHLNGGLPFERPASTVPLRETVKAHTPTLRLSEERWTRWEAACDRLLNDEAALSHIANWRGYSREIVIAAASARLMGLWEHSSWPYRGVMREAFLIVAPEHCTVADGKATRSHALVPVSLHVRLAPHTPGNPKEKQMWVYDPASTAEHPVKSWPFLWGNPVGSRWLFITEGQWDAMALADACGWRSPETLPPGCAIVGLRGSGGIRRFLEDFPFDPNGAAICLGDDDRAGEQWHDEGGLLDTLREKVATVLSYRPNAPGCKDLNDLVKAGLFHGEEFLEMVRERLQMPPPPPKHETFRQWCRARREQEDAHGRAARFVLADKHEERPGSRAHPTAWEAHWRRLEVPGELFTELRAALKAWSEPAPPTTPDEP